MVAASDYAFRCLVRQYSNSQSTSTSILTFTQMLHAKHVVHNAQFRINHCDFYEVANTNTNTGTDTDTDTRRHGGIENALPALVTAAQTNYLDGLQRYEDASMLPSCFANDDKETAIARSSPFTTGPLIVQLAGHNPTTVVQAAEWIVRVHDNDNANDNEDNSQLIHGVDLNCGCPQQIARKGNYGAFFMEDDNGKQAAVVLRALRAALPPEVAVSCKLRLPLDVHDNDKAWKERVLRMADAGVNFVTVHGRTLKENKTLTDRCNLQAIHQAVEWLQEYGVAVIANGGVETAVDVQRVLQTTGAAACMSSEGLLERPDLFAINDHDSDAMSSPRDTLKRQFQMTRDYLAWTRLYPPLPGVLGQDGGTFNIVRGHLFKFLHRYWQEQTDLRDALASHSRQCTLRDAYALVNELHTRYDDLNDEQLAALSSSSNPNASWYRRHWKAHGVSSVTSHRDSETTNVNRNNGASDASPSTTTITVDQRKALAVARIAKLQEQREAKKKAAAATNKQAQKASSSLV